MLAPDMPVIEVCDWDDEDLRHDVVVSEQDVDTVCSWTVFVRGGVPIRELLSEAGAPPPIHRSQSLARALVGLQPGDRSQRVAVINADQLDLR
jgi:hypothetical protein